MTVKHTLDLPDLRLHKILGSIKLPVGKKTSIDFAQTSTQQLRLFLFPPDQDQSAAKEHTGTHFGEQKSTPQAGIFGGGPSTMQFPLPLSVLTSGDLPHPQSAQTAMPHERIYPTIFFSAQQREMPGHGFCTNTQASWTGLIKNYKTSSSHPALAFRHSFKNDT